MEREMTETEMDINVIAPRQNCSAAAEARNAGFDVLRGFAITLMVMGHIGFSQPFQHYLHAFHMPVFFFVSGYFFNSKKHRGFGRYLLKNLRTLMLPYTIFFLLCQVLHVLYTKHFSLGYSILSYFTSNHNRVDVAGAYWFLPCMFSIRLLFWFIEKIKSDWLKLLCVVPICILGHIQNNQIPYYLPFCMDSAMTCLPIMLAGYMLRKKKDTLLAKKLMSLPLWAALTGLVLNAALIMINPDVNIRTNHHGFIPLYWLNCFFAIWLWLTVSRAVAASDKGVVRAASSMLAYFGKNSMTFLVFNELMIFAVRTVLNMILPDAVMSACYIGDMLILIISMCGLVITNMVCSRTKLRILIGK